MRDEYARGKYAKCAGCRRPSRMTVVDVRDIYFGVVVTLVCERGHKTITWMRGASKRT